MCSSLRSTNKLIICTIYVDALSTVIIFVLAFYVAMETLLFIFCIPQSFVTLDEVKNYKSFQSYRYQFTAGWVIMIPFVLGNIFHLQP